MSTILISGPASPLRDAIQDDLAVAAAQSIIFNWAIPGIAPTDVVKSEGPAITLTIDPLSDESWRDAKQFLSHHSDQLDHLICLAPDMMPSAPLAVDASVWSDALDIAVGATIQNMRCAEPLLRKSRGASVIIVAEAREGISIAGAGLEALARSVANRWAIKKPVRRLNLVHCMHGTKAALPFIRYLMSLDASFVTGTATKLNAVPLGISRRAEPRESEPARRD